MVNDKYVVVSWPVARNTMPELKKTFSSDHKITEKDIPIILRIVENNTLLKGYKFHQLLCIGFSCNFLYKKRRLLW